MVSFWLCLEDLLKDTDLGGIAAAGSKTTAESFVAMDLIVVIGSRTATGS